RHLQRSGAQLKIRKARSQAWLLPRRRIFNGAERAVKDTESRVRRLGFCRGGESSTERSAVKDTESALAWLGFCRGGASSTERSAVKDTETELAWLIENFLPRRCIFNGAERS
ncbi:MAG: hypothetical protein J1F29_00540, partial [Lentimicrobiaceae bacterium]|nr:hypothetical protein [Lentimicrobiaceae bacterium]